MDAMNKTGAWRPLTEATRTVVVHVLAICEKKRNDAGLQSVWRHARRGVSATSFSLAHCRSSVTRFPSAVEAKPHCGLRARFSRGTYRDASSMRIAN